MDADRPKAERLDWRLLIDADANTPQNVCDALDKHFGNYAKPAGERNADGKFVFSDGQPCIQCGKSLRGISAFMHGGGFTWGLTHGEGHCAGCGWPATCYHFVKDADGYDVLTLRGVILQYHPDLVERRAPVSATAA